MRGLDHDLCFHDDVYVLKNSQSVSHAAQHLGVRFVRELVGSGQAVVGEAYTSPYHRSILYHEY